MKMKVKVSLYNAHNAVIRWRILTSANVNWLIFALAVSFRDIIVSNMWPWKFRPRSRSTTFAMFSFDWKYLTSIKVIHIRHCSLALTIFETLTFQNWCPWKRRSRSWYMTFAVAPFDGKYIASYLMAIVMFALSHTICEIIAKLIKCQG